MLGGGGDVKGATKGGFVGVERPSSKTNGLPMGRVHDASTKRNFRVEVVRGFFTVQQSLR